LIADNSIEGEQPMFQQSCHSVEDAAKAANARVDKIAKNICMIDSEGNRS